MKRYLFISATDFENRKLTGAHKRFIELVNSIAVNNEVVLISHKYSGFENKHIELIPITEIKGKSLPNHISELFTLTYFLKKYKKTISYDVAIAFGAHTAIAYYLAGYTNIVSLFREDLIGYQKALDVSKLKIWYFKQQENIAVKASSMIIVQCQHDREALIARHENIGDKVFVQCNNINVSWIKKYTKNTDNANDNVVLLFIGNFSDKRKGHQLLLPAVAKLMDEGTNVELFVLGDGQELENYKSQYSSYDRIHFEGHVNDVGKYVAMADIDIVPSLIDSCPNTVLEGLHAGLAVYGSNTGGIPELLKDAKYMFNADVVSIYDFLKAKIEKEEYISDSVNQKVLVEQLTFDWPSSIERFIQLALKYRGEYSKKYER